MQCKLEVERIEMTDELILKTDYALYNIKFNYVLITLVSCPDRRLALTK